MTCCFLGHREIYDARELRTQLYQVIEDLIVHEKVDTFLFGSKSCFNALCYELITELKKKYPHLKRIYVRAEFPVISQEYNDYLLERYEETYYPTSVLGAGKLVYIKRNMEMINRSHFCVFYYNASYIPKGRKSGTKIAFEYAVKRKKKIYCFPLLPSAPQTAFEG